MLGIYLPYLISDSGQVPSGFLWDIPWVSEDVVSRYIEFVLVEFALVAAMLVIREPRDLLLWVAIGILLVLPIYRFCPTNDLVMHTSIPAILLLAIRIGRWLSTPASLTEKPMLRTIAVVLLAIGAVTPLMELSRPFLVPPRQMNVRSSLIDVTRGTHYLRQPSLRPWLERFLRQPTAS